MEVPSSDTTEIGSWSIVASEAGVLLLCLLAAYSVVLLYLCRKTIDGQLPLPSRSLRGRLLFGMGVAAILPTLSLGMVLSERTLDNATRRSAVRLEQDVYSIARSVDLFLDKHRSAIINLAATLEAMGQLEPRNIEHWLYLHHGNYGDFLTMLAANSESEVVAATVMRQGELHLLQDVVERIGDRSFFQQPMMDGRPYLSNAFEGRCLVTDPIIAVSAAVHWDGGKRWGIVEGSLDLQAFANFEKRHTSYLEASIVILDESDQVIYATPDTGLESLQRMTGHPLLVTSQDTNDGDAFVLEYAPGSESELQSFMAVAMTVANGWHVFVQLPLRSVLADRRDELQVIATWFVFAISIATVLALALASSIAVPIRQLSQAVSKLDPKSGGDSFAAPRQSPSELLPVFQHLQESGNRLRRSYRELESAFESGERLRTELNHVLASREREIEERTKELREANVELERLNAVDSLTGLSNRRRLSEFLPQVWSSARREKAPVSVLVIDVDHFKAFNDRYGHLAGDDCLRSIAKALATAARRPLDLVARFGGEEFVVLLFDTLLSGALDVAEEVRRSIEELKIPHEGCARGVVTVSIGVYSMTPGRATDPKRLIATADSALYAAKEHNRNCIGYMENGQLWICSPGVPQRRAEIRDVHRVDDH